MEICLEKEKPEGKSEAEEPEKVESVAPASPAPAASPLEKVKAVLDALRKWPWPTIGWYAAGVAGWIAAGAMFAHPAWRVTPEMASQAIARADQAEAAISRARAMEPAYHAASDLELLAQIMLFARPQGGRLVSFVLGRSEAGAADAKIVALVEGQGSLREFASMYANSLEREIAVNTAGPVSFLYELAEEFATDGGVAVTIRGTVARQSTASP
ncbi:hypothetical protein [Verrucomicrobium sp. 3C]|uniref:hypothetical protein n=1 Tax=Verrucomicrobium sp. 3C TaxID=1134055 RepID=UPI0003777138|nr:hypothetical protein [Verrucomicrobium sp. 3C]